jgi:hypothetical protein
MTLKLTNTDIPHLAKQYGIHYASGAKILTDADRINIAMDADYIGGTAQTVANAGIPALLTTWIDTKVIETVVAPMKLASVFGEVQKGSRSQPTVQFLVLESNGETSTYGDFNENGMSGTNVNFPTRQAYHYQTIVKVGELEQEIAGEAKLDWASQKQISAQLTLNKFQNQSYLYGIANLQNYGMLNDPSLFADIVGINWYSATAEQVFVEIQKLYEQLVKQGQGNVTRDDAMTLLMSPAMDAHLTKTNSYGLNVYDLVKKNFPNLKLETIPEYSLATGEKLQLILDSFEGQKTCEMAFTEKMRTGAVVMELSGWAQKRSQGTLGAIIYRPVFIVGMLAINTP